jgi:hypothetical protein
VRRPGREARTDGTRRTAHVGWLARHWRLTILIAILLGSAGVTCIGYRPSREGKTVRLVLGVVLHNAGFLVGVAAVAGFLWQRTHGQQARVPPDPLSAPLNPKDEEYVTGRRVLDRRARRSGLIAYTGLGLCAVGLAGNACCLLYYLVLIPLGLPIVWTGVIYANLRIRCPWCRTKLSQLWKGGLSFDRSVKRCPYCERSLDEEVAAPGALIGLPDGEGSLPNTSPPDGITPYPNGEPIRSAPGAGVRMSGRDLFTRRNVRAFQVVYLGLGLFVTGLVGGLVGGVGLIVFSLVGGLILFPAVVFITTWGMRCPRCRNNLYGLSDDARLCPYCEYRLDDELPEPSASDPGAGNE